MPDPMSAGGSEHVLVVGQGYVGLPVTMAAVAAGFDVTGYDVDDTKTQSLNAARSYIEDVTDADLTSALESGRYRAVSDLGSVPQFDVAVISVPTPLADTLPDLTYIEQAARDVGSRLHAGATVILESTTYPGTTEELVQPILESESGLRAGTDFYLGYSPERIDPGNHVWTLVTTPKIVAGIDGTSLGKVDAFFSRLVDRTVPMSGTREAELSKLLENTFRHVNIALVNELAMFAGDLGIDIWESIRGASSKPFGFMPFTPGPGVGGHCLPVDPSYLSWQVRRSLGTTFRFVELANDINDHMPDYVVARIGAALNRCRKPVNGSRIALLGLAYKKNTGDTRESPSRPISRQLLELGATVVAVDPYVDQDAAPAGVEVLDDLADAGAGSDLVVVLVDHDQFDYGALVDRGVPVLDCRNVVPRSDSVEHL